MIFLRKEALIGLVLSFSMIDLNCYAASLRISPIKVDFLENQKAQSLSIYNQSSEPVSIQARVFLWTQEDGKEVLKPTNDLVVSPPFMKMQSASSYNYRIIRLDNSPVSTEKSYRLILDELPKPNDSNNPSQNLNVLLRTSIPVFIKTKNDNLNLTWNIKFENNQNFLIFSNQSSSHKFLSRFILNDETIDKKYTVNLTTMNGYILSGKSKKYILDKNFLYQSNHHYSVNVVVDGKENKL
ncbi:molecular chaperone [Acinetobacter sp. ANC 3791]|uniref:fimbrial biogenesis chaperone n=1 Tax=Acinetobacter sp. ANC 3791 TaxID=2529836 RepID=UPI001040720B|nr:fimbria/pilus periplasmic chaperone [Acinetobacter sp. ANC 3791]TCB86449.1 molecular chaperone [Acinetobacter sp. ANC 3791]